MTQSPENPQTKQRQQIHVTGVVQGVGFRPFVYNLAQTQQLSGFVGNNSSGVFIEIEGVKAQLDSFRDTLLNNPPPLAIIESVTTKTIPLQGSDSFEIVVSAAQAEKNTLVSPDICICDDCLTELFDPDNRRYRYPFINCTNCGPRFTIIKDVPYDRPATTMAPFLLCTACQAEYDDPTNRRFHAQPNACTVCGPEIWLELSNSSLGTLADDKDPITLAQNLLRDGKVVAVKGLGGFHLACDATNNAALATLRERKGRADKPFALMALDVETIRPFAHISSTEEKLLTSKERPIVLLRKKTNNPLAELVAPGNQHIGVMLPYTPLHYLLLSPTAENGQKMPVLVMTSGNFANEPIIKENTSARTQLIHLADALLLHNRDIHVHCDDSVLRIVDKAEMPVRRSRGYAPFPIKLPFKIGPALAVGGELKATFCLGHSAYAFMSQHIGDMENLETLTAFSQTVLHFEELFGVKPQILVSDLHPGYLSTRWAQDNTDQRKHIQVQHHHAHIAAVMGENGLDAKQSVLGFSFDGTGYGLDGAIWGGEVMVANYETFERVSHLKYVSLVGGDVAVKRPYRLALAHLSAAGIAWDDDLPPVQACPHIERGIIQRQLDTQLNSVPTSSMGRLFDAVASLIGICQSVTYEAQAAIELEAAIDSTVPIEPHAAYRFTIEADEFNAAPVIRAIVKDLRAGLAASTIAAKFHTAVAHLILQLSLNYRKTHGLNIAALSGGVFQNATLLQAATQLLKSNEFTVLTHRQVPPNDGGLALGQLLIGSSKV
ncbi:MAG: carbamoyltransferase HypF [Anaerolineales bacterium]|nr:carbamoyltransferase HypF [Anaerolineales bacterium]